jgi:hypothetical protein
MKRKLILTLGFAGVLALSVVGFAENFHNTKVSAEEQNRVENSSAKEGFVPQGKLLTKGSDFPTVITVEEQNRAEKMLKNMPIGVKVFVPQENGTGFYVSKTK